MLKEWVPPLDNPSLRLARARRRLAMPEKRGIEMLCRHAVRCVSSILVILCAALPLGAYAQQATQSTNPTEIPARLRHLEGTVTVQRAAAGEIEQAVMNLPLGSGDRIWSAESGRVEIMFEDGTSVWMDGGTTLDFVSLPLPEGLNGAIVRLWTGSVFVHRPAPQSGTLLPLRMDSPAGTVIFDEAGLFRVDLDENSGVWLAAYDGSAALDAGGLSERVYAGQRTLAELGSAPARAVAFNTSEADEFSNWRDERMALLAATQQFVRQRDYVPDNIAPYAADLEPYGDWSYHPTYAAWYWRPYAAVAWSPYRHGRWVYTSVGWSWVPEAPWGYVTTHYGRWQYGGNGWMWFPGRVWAPASVRWYVGGGYVGWAPLNYRGRPAVSFGVHIGGGVGGSFGGYYDYPYYGSYSPYYGSYYPYYGYGYLNWGYRSCYRCGGWGGRRHNRPVHYTSRRGRSDRVGPIGSASGTGRVVAGRGYSSGLADAWTVVPAGDLSAPSVGRIAVARSALPRDLSQASKALVTGTLRARRPSTLVPQARRLARRTTAGNGAAVNGAARRTTGASTRARRAVPTAGRTPRAIAPTAVRATPSGRTTLPTPSIRSRSVPPTGTRRALPRNIGVAPRSRGTLRRSPPTLRSATPSRAAPSPRRSGSIRSAPSVRRVPAARPGRSVRAAPSPRTGGGIARPPTRSGGGGARSKARVAKPRRGGSG